MFRIKWLQSNTKQQLSITEKAHQYALQFATCTATIFKRLSNTADESNFWRIWHIKSLYFKCFSKVHTMIHKNLAVYLWEQLNQTVNKFSKVLYGFNPGWILHMLLVKFQLMWHACVPPQLIILLIQKVNTGVNIQTVNNSHLINR